MDSIDDDFGDLYVDVEAQASSAVNGGADCGKVCSGSKCNTDCDRNMERESTIQPSSEAGGEKLDLVTEEANRCVAGGGATPTLGSYEPEASDSDDDLNILLNDGDTEVLPGTCGSNCGESRRSDAVTASAGAGAAAAAANGVGGSENGSCVMSYDATAAGRTKMNASTNNTSANQAPLMHQCGYSFSLLWYRNLFDKNIDLSEEKPWRNPGADRTDFFNFGFNEESWREYCKSLKQHYLSCCEHVKKALEDDVNGKILVESPSNSTDGGSRPLMLPKGRAIEVEDRIFERIPSVDLRHARNPDPGVVIQVPVADSVRGQLGLTTEEVGHLDMRLNEASGNEDLHSDNKRDSHSSIDTEEQTSEGFQEGNIRTSSDERYHQKENFCSPEGIPCDNEVIHEDGKEVCRESDWSDPYMSEGEPSPRDRIHFSPTPSYSAGKNEESEDSESDSWRGSASHDRFEVHIPPRQIQMEESDHSKYRICEGNSVNVGERNGRKRSRYRGPHQEPRKRHCGRSYSPVHRGVKHQTYNDRSPVSNLNAGKIRCARHKRSPCNSSRYQYRKPLLDLKRDENDGKGFPMSDTERHYNRLNAYVNYSRYRERLYKFGSQRSEESPHYKVMEHSNGYTSRRFLEDYTVCAPSNYPHRKSRWSFKREEDCCGRRHYERSYFHERSDIPYNKNIRDRNWYDSQRDPFFEDKASLTDRDFRWRSLEYPSNYRRGNRNWTEENGLKYRYWGDYDYKLHCHRYESEIWGEKYGVPLELVEGEKHCFDEPLKKGFPVYERELEFSGRGGRYDYSPNWHFDRFASKKADYDRRSADARPLSTLPFRESWMGTLTGTTDVEDNLTNESNWVYPDRRRYNLKDDIQDSMRGVMHREHPFLTDGMLACNRRTSTCDWTSIRQRSGHDKGHIHEIQDQSYRFKKMREDYDRSAFSRNVHVHAFQRCQDPIDLIGRKGEFGRRSSNGRRSEGNGHNEKKCTKSANSRDRSDGARTDPPKRVTGINLNSKSNEKMAGRFMVTAKSQDLGIKEEGEISEEPNNTKKRALYAEDAKKVEIDEERILETLKKMEKRRARFNEPITPTKDLKPVVTLETQAEPTVEIDETMQQRPARKRRWAAN